MHGLWRQDSGAALHMDILDHSEDEEQSHYGSGGGGGGGGGRGSTRFGARRRQKPRSKSHHQLLLMDCVVGNREGASEEAVPVPLPEYERLSQSARLPDDPDPKNPPLRQQQKPAAWRLIEYVRSRNKSGGAGAAGGCGSSADGDSRSSDGEKEGDGGGDQGKKDDKKKRSSWLPDPDRRWPVQGFY